MKLVLTGFMGSGKTSVGQELSRRLGYPLLDTDLLIEEREKMLISLIFKKKGEDYFRSVERLVVEDVSKQDRTIIATGGGIVKDKRNVENLSQRGIIVWLKTDPEVILRRTMSEGGKRPLLDVKDPLIEINRLLAEREPLYEQADIVIDTSFITPKEAAQEIIEMLALESEVTVSLKERSYSILIGRKTLNKLGIRVKEFRPSKVAIITNPTVWALYGDACARSLKEHSIEPLVIAVPDGEEYKELLWVSNIYSELLKARFDRGSILIALGGGVIGDMAGFVAATYMRGIRYIQVPTTLLAQVDSSVGGKTGVNHPLGKNMIGAFYQPSLVLIDVETLKTLPQREFRAGIAEIIKYGVIADREFVEYIEKNRANIIALDDDLMHVIKRSCEIKASVVEKDEREAGLRAILNYGHTIGHAIETTTGYTRFLHGEAVAIGMCLASDLAVKIGLLQRKEAQRIKTLVRSYGLPTTIPDDIDVSSILDSMEIDKKVKSGQMRFILPVAIGEVEIREVIDRRLITEILMPQTA